MHTAGYGFSEASFIETYMIRKLDYFALSSLYIFRKTSARFISKILFIRAVYKITLLAIMANTAGYRIVGGDSVALPEGRYGIAYFMDITGKFMAGDKRITGAAAPTGYFMIRFDSMTDTTAHHFYDYVMTSTNGIWHLTYGCILSEWF
jgi:hypothetical protein